MKFCQVENSRHEDHENISGKQKEEFFFTFFFFDMFTRLASNSWAQTDPLATVSQAAGTTGVLLHLMEGRIF
jgi:hypothetical protein